MEKITKISMYLLCVFIINGCTPAYKEKAPPENFTKGVYEPFSTDNLVPEATDPYQDNDENYYPVYYYN